jgi:hypothetical protein
MQMDRADLDDLRRAKLFLEQPSLAIRLADKVGVPLELLLDRLPAGAQDAIARGTRRALDKSLEVALRTLDPADRGPTSDWLHRGVVVASGAFGGALGLPGLALELPFSLTVMLRSIADHARAQGEDLGDVTARLECLAVFAYGTRSRSDDAAESAYFAARAALAQALRQAAEYVGQRGIAGALGERSAPAVAHLLARVAQRFGVAVTDKAAAQLVPIAGAAGGAAINALFMTHYQETSRAHFTIRRLERTHGAEAVRAAYDVA